MYGQSRALGENEGVSILYCHGWGSHLDPSKNKIRALSKMRPVDGITVDYTLHTHLVFERFAAQLKRHPETLCIGTSLGGFFAAWLTDAKIKISMDGKGRWIDNRMIERLWRSLKYEGVYMHAFERGSEAKTAL